MKRTRKVCANNELAESVMWIGKVGIQQTHSGGVATGVRTTLGQMGPGRMGTRTNGPRINGPPDKNVPDKWAEQISD